MANFHEKYGIPLEAQTAVDGTFLQIAIDTHTNGKGLPGETRDELENIHARTQGQVAEALLDGRAIPDLVITNLGRISFIDSLCLSSTEILSKKEAKDVTNPGESLLTVEHVGVLTDKVAHYRRRLFRTIERNSPK